MDYESNEKKELLSAASERVLAVFDRRHMPSKMPSVPGCPGWGGNTDRLLPRSFTIARCVGEHPHNHRTWAVRYNSASACKKIRARVTPSIIHRHPAKTQGRVTNAHVSLATCPTHPPSWPVVFHQPFRPAFMRGGSSPHSSHNHTGLCSSRSQRLSESESRVDDNKSGA